MVWENLKTIDTYEMNGNTSHFEKYEAGPEERAINNIAIALQNNARATVTGAAILGVMFSESITVLGNQIAGQLRNIANELKRTRLTQEYFNIMSKISECAAVLDEETARSNLEKLQNPTCENHKMELVKITTPIPEKKQKRKQTPPGEYQPNYPPGLKQVRLPDGTVEWRQA